MLLKYLFKVHASSHASHAGYTSHTSWHTSHTARTADIHVRSFVESLALFILIDPFAEISLDESVLDFFFGETGPILGLFVLFEENETEGAGGQA
jgi:hypothetical protein